MNWIEIQTSHDTVLSILEYGHLRDVFRHRTPVVFHPGWRPFYNNAVWK